MFAFTEGTYFFFGLINKTIITLLKLGFKGFAPMEKDKNHLWYRHFTEMHNHQHHGNLHGAAEVNCILVF